MLFHRLLSVSLILFVAVGCRATNHEPSVITPREIAVSESLPTISLQSAAIWIHPTDANSSLLFIPNVAHGLQVHHLDGTLVQHLDSLMSATSVGVVYNFSNNGAITDLVIVAHTTTKTLDSKVGGVSLLPIDANKDEVADDQSAVPVKTFASGSETGRVPDLLCTYRSHVTGRRFFFAMKSDGSIEQWEIIATESHQISAKLTRSLTLGGDLSGCVADDDAGLIFIADRKAGIRQFNAEPDMPLNDSVAIASGANSPLRGIGAIALYCGAGGEGYLMVVNEVGPRGATHIDLFDRIGAHPFIASIAPSLHRASGIAITNQPTVPEFPNGILAVADAVSADGSPTFRLYSWNEIATAAKLLIDPTWSARPALYRW